MGRVHAPPTVHAPRGEARQWNEEELENLLCGTWKDHRTTYSVSTSEVSPGNVSSCVWFDVRYYNDGTLQSRKKLIWIYKVSTGRRQLEIRWGRDPSYVVQMENLRANSLTWIRPGGEKGVFSWTKISDTEECPEDLSNSSRASSATHNERHREPSSHKAKVPPLASKASPALNRPPPALNKPPHERSNGAASSSSMAKCPPPKAPPPQLQVAEKQRQRFVQMGPAPNSSAPRPPPGQAMAAQLMEETQYKEDKPMVKAPPPNLQWPLPQSIPPPIPPPPMSPREAEWAPMANKMEEDYHEEDGMEAGDICPPPAFAPPAPPCFLPTGPTDCVEQEVDDDDDSEHCPPPYMAPPAPPDSYSSFSAQPESSMMFSAAAQGAHHRTADAWPEDLLDGIENVLGCEEDFLQEAIHAGIAGNGMDHHARPNPSEDDDLFASKMGASIMQAPPGLHGKGPTGFHVDDATWKASTTDSDASRQLQGDEDPWGQDAARTSCPPESQSSSIDICWNGSDFWPREDEDPDATSKSQPNSSEDPWAANPPADDQWGSQWAPEDQHTQTQATEDSWATESSNSGGLFAETVQDLGPDQPCELAKDPFRDQPEAPAVPIPVRQQQLLDDWSADLRSALNLGANEVEEAAQAQAPPAGLPSSQPASHFQAYPASQHSQPASYFPKTQEAYRPKSQSQQSQQAQQPEPTAQQAQVSRLLQDMQDCVQFIRNLEGSCSWQGPVYQFQMVQHEYMKKFQELESLKQSFAQLTGHYPDTSGWCDYSNLSYMPQMSTQYTQSSQYAGYSPMQLHGSRMQAQGAVQQSRVSYNEVRNATGPAAQMKESAKASCMDSNGAFWSTGKSSMVTNGKTPSLPGNFHPHALPKALRDGAMREVRSRQDKDFEFQSRSEYEAHSRSVAQDMYMDAFEARPPTSSFYKHTDTLRKASRIADHRDYDRCRVPREITIGGREYPGYDFD